MGIVGRNSLSGGVFATTGYLRRLPVGRPVLAMLWLAGLYLLYVTVAYYVDS